MLEKTEYCVVYVNHSDDNINPLLTKLLNLADL